MIKKKESSPIFIGIMIACGILCAWSTFSKAEKLEKFCFKNSGEFNKCLSNVNEAIEAVKSQQYNPITAMHSCKKEPCKKRHLAELNAREGR